MLVIQVCLPRVAAYIGSQSYQIACHMLAEYQIELAYAKHLRVGAFIKAPPCIYDPMEHSQIVDNIHTLQEHDPRSADVSESRLEAVGFLAYHDSLCASS